MSAKNHGREGGQLYILLPVHNRREITLRFIEALCLQTWREFQLILIDDGSSDGTMDAVRKQLPAVEVITGYGNWWWAGSLDQGCRYLHHKGINDNDILLLINDDVEMDPKFLEEALDEFKQTQNTLLLARQVDARTGSEIDHGGGVRVDLKQLRFTPARNPEEINCLPTRGLFLRWRDMIRVGGFRPECLPHYLSDYEFTLRAGRKGLQLKVAQAVSITVRMDQSGRSLKSLFSETRIRRFGLIFSKRFKDNPVTWSCFVWLVASPARKPYLWFKIWFHFLITAARSLIIPVERVENR